ncbi:MAG: hypothetical protein OEM24_03835 [Paracoccaceae bacterium]|nr:hypothetical protein [Paracoccaceae bacterium]
MPRIKLLAAAALVALSTPLAAQDAPFGSAEDQSYAAGLWQLMLDANLAGEGAVQAFPYPGTDPHGMMLETFYTRATVDGHTGALVVKRNYGPEGVSVDEVIGDPAGHLGAVTIMFRREAGYDDENGDWFWAKYLPDGSLDVAPNGLPLAGRVGKGADTGCIACHRGAGDDLLFTTDAALR